MVVDAGWNWLLQVSDGFPSSCWGATAASQVQGHTPLVSVVQGRTLPFQGPCADHTQSGPMGFLVPTPQGDAQLASSQATAGSAGSPRAAPVLALCPF